MRLLLALVILLPSLPAFSQTPIAEMANAVPVCSESPACVITAISDPTAILQFGSGAKWCQTVVASTLKLPAAVSYTNSALCPYDPFPYTNKTLAVQQKSTAYTVAISLAGVPQPPKTIAAMAPTSTAYKFSCPGTIAGTITLDTAGNSTITLSSVALNSGCNGVKQ